MLIKLETQIYKYCGFKVIDLTCYIKALNSTWISIGNNDSKLIMLLKKTVNTDRLIHTGSESLEIQHLAHKNQNMDRYTLNVYHKFQE